MPATLSQKALEEAADWLMALQQGPLDPGEECRFSQWLHRNPENSQAWQRAQRLTAKLERLPPAIARAALDRPERPERREAIAKLGLLAAAVPVGWSVWEIAQKQRNVADYRTSVGHMQSITSADGSHITLNTDSAIDVAFDDERRLVVLRNGEIHVETSLQPDPRPFLVHSAQGHLRALGTRFTVRQLSGATRLAVLQGAVEISPRDGEPVVVRAGQQASFSTRHAHSSTLTKDFNATWTSGMFMADGTPLRKLIEELNRFRHGSLRVDPAVAELAISGAFPLTDTDQALDMLAETYPLTVRRVLFGYLIQVVPK